MSDIYPPSFIPGLSRAGLGRKPSSQQARLAQKLRLCESYSLDHLQTLFGEQLPSWFCRFKTLAKDNSRDRLYTPIMTFWTFLAQVMDVGSCCDTAVARLQSFRLTKKLPAMSGTSGGYCTARARLSLLLLVRLMHWLSAAVVRAAGDFTSSSDINAGRLLVMDGTSATLNDSKANRSMYSYPTGQKEGCGFPKMYLLALFDLRSGACLRMVKSAKLRHDSALAWKLLAHLRTGDTLVADRAFCSYAFLCACQSRGVTVVMRLHQQRVLDASGAQKLGKNDAVYTWKRPGKRPKGTPEALFDKLPATLKVRVVTHHVETRGHRRTPIYLATTILDAATTSAAEIAALYLKRWNVELFFDDLKTSQSMETLRCKSPHMLVRELVMHIIAYNLVRMTIVTAEKLRPAGQKGRLSYLGTLNRITQWHPTLWGCVSAQRRADLYAQLILQVSKAVVTDRPDRSEPRKVKRRPKAFPPLKEPRAVERLKPEPPKHSPTKKAKTRQPLTPSEIQIQAA